MHAKHALKPTRTASANSINQPTHLIISHCNIYSAVIHRRRRQFTVYYKSKQHMILIRIQRPNPRARMPAIACVRTWFSPTRACSQARAYAREMIYTANTPAQNTYPAQSECTIVVIEQLSCSRMYCIHYLSEAQDHISLHYLFGRHVLGARACVRAIIAYTVTLCCLRGASACNKVIELDATQHSTAQHTGILTKNAECVSKPWN